MKTSQVTSVLDYKLPPVLNSGISQKIDIWLSKENGHYSMGDDDSTTKSFSPYNNGGSTGSESMMGFQGMNRDEFSGVSSHQMTLGSSNSSVMMASLPADNNTQQNNRGDYFCSLLVNFI